MKEVWIKSLKGTTSVVLYNSSHPINVTEQWVLIRVSEPNYNRIRKMRNITYSDTNPNSPNIDRIRLKSIRLKGFELDNYDLSLEIGKYGYAKLLPIPRDIELTDKHNFIITTDSPLVVSYELRNTDIVIKGLSKGKAEIKVSLGIWEQVMRVIVL